jgi:cytochrome oxidase Cu insertion factor (SCO1/SenC/PrrC family)
VNTESKTKSSLSSRWVLLLVGAIFFLPVIGAIALFQSGWRPATHVNNGELVLPARLLTDMALTAQDGRERRLSQLRDKWTMLYFGPADCDADCRHRVYLMRQVHIAQGPEQDRVQRVYVVTGPGSYDTLLKDYPNMQFLSASADKLRQLAAQFQLPAGSPLDNLRRVYLVDPAGYLMMSYPSEAQGEGMRRDLVRLLKLSKNN